MRSGAPCANLETTIARHAGRYGLRPSLPLQWASLRAAPSATLMGGGLEKNLFSTPLPLVASATGAACCGSLRSVRAPEHAVIYT